MPTHLSPAINRQPAFLCPKSNSAPSTGHPSLKIRIDEAKKMMEFMRGFSETCGAIAGKPDGDSFFKADFSQYKKSIEPFKQYDGIIRSLAEYLDNGIYRDLPPEDASLRKKIHDVSFAWMQNYFSNGISEIPKMRENVEAAQDKLSRHAVMTDENSVAHLNAAYASEGNPYQSIFSFLRRNGEAFKVKSREYNVSDAFSFNCSEPKVKVNVRNEGNGIFSFFVDGNKSPVFYFASGDRVWEVKAGAETSSFWTGKERKYAMSEYSAQNGWKGGAPKELALADIKYSWFGAAANVVSKGWNEGKVWMGRGSRFAVYTSPAGWAQVFMREVFPLVGKVFPSLISKG
ncbi:MAG: hypothetical protein NTW04_05480, partial [Elusimicrobia bacterium]|nr:hypothetical protein [Elusimicrobiota bacterium]